MRALAVKLAFLSSLGSWPLGALAQAVVDQQQAAMIPLTVEGAYAVGASYHQRLAQVVTAGVDGRLVAIATPLVCSPGSSALLEIQGVVADGAGHAVPDGVARSATIIPDALAPYPADPAAPDLRTLALATPVSLAAGDRFAFILSSAGECALVQAPVGDLYAGGDAWYRDDLSAPYAAWTPLGLSRFDLAFQTWMEAAPQEPPGTEPRHVRVDVRPGSPVNPINLGARGVVPVAIIGSRQFDVREVEVASVRFAGAAPVAHRWGLAHTAVEDVNRDGIPDLVLQFWIPDLDLLPGDTEAELTGVTSDGAAFVGSDAIRVVPARRRSPAIWKMRP